MPTLRLAPAEKLETTLVFEIGSTQIEDEDLAELKAKDVVLLDRLTLRPDLKKGGVTDDY